MGRCLAWLEWAALCLAAAVAAAPPVPADTVIFLNANVVPMDVERVLLDQTVVVEDGEIVALGPAAEVGVPDEGVVIDARDRWLIPALADMHAHLGGEPAFHRAILELYWTHGVTTVLDLWGSPAALEARRALRRGERRGPRLYVASPAVDDAALDREAGSRLAREHLAAGYDFLKVYSGLSAEGFAGLAEAARRGGGRLVGHVPHAVGLERALAGGLEMISHAEEYLYGHLGFDVEDLSRPASRDLDAARIPEMVELARRAGLWTAPSLIAFERILEFVEDPSAVLRRPATGYLSPSAREVFAWNEGSRYLRQFPTAAHRDRLRAALDYQRRLVAVLQASSLPVLAGTDATIVGVLPGESVHEELERLVGAGLSPFEALQAATFNPARFLGLAAEAGTVELGKRGDLLLLADNPLQDIRATRAISGLLMRGRWTPAEEIGRARGELRDSYRPEERFFALLEDEGAAEATAYYLAVRSEDPGVTLFTEGALNRAGYRALEGEGGTREAIRLFRLNAMAFPGSANVYDSLGEAYARAGLLHLAIPNYGKALELDPDGAVGRNARRMLEQLQAEPQEPPD